MPPRKTPKPEHHRVPGAEILLQDTWGEDVESCPECGAAVSADDARCRACGQWLARCASSCADCASPRCVGGGRNKQSKS